MRHQLRVKGEHGVSPVQEHKGTTEPSPGNTGRLNATGKEE